MADRYIYSGAGGAGTGADWANAYTTLAAALTAGSAGDAFWVADDHAETQASSMTCTSPGTAASPCTVICVLRTGGSVPPVAADMRTTATVTTTGANAMTLAGGETYWYGLTFNCGTGAVSSALSVGNTQNSYHVFDSSNFKKLGTSANASAIAFGHSSGARVRMVNCTVSFGNTGDRIVTRGDVLWEGGSITGATIPSSLFQFGSTSRLVMCNADLSALAANGLYNTAGNVWTNVFLERCRLHASTTIATPANNTQSIVLSNASSAAINYLLAKYLYTGTQTVTTAVTRTGGAAAGGTAIAWSIVTTANSEIVTPFASLPINIANDRTSSITVTVYGTWGGGAVPDNNDLWMTVDYLGNASYPLGSAATTAPATILTTPSSYSSDGSTWSGGTTPFKMTATFTPAMTGMLQITIYAALASTTFYIDPKPVIS